jgi:hypothetical protein
MAGGESRMRPLDVFIRNVTPEQLEAVVSEYPKDFICAPVPLWIDNGTEEEPAPELLGYHAKVTSKFYAKAKSKYSTKIYLYQKLTAKFRANGCPMHVFGSGGGIDTATDTEDDATFARFEVGKDYAISADRKSAFRIYADSLVQMTAQELSDNGIEVTIDD